MLGDKLKELRKEHGLTQQELSEIIGVAQNTLANYEKNNRTPSPDILIKIADYFKVTIDYLLR